MTTGAGDLVEASQPVTLSSIQAVLDYIRTQDFESRPGRVFLLVDSKLTLLSSIGPDETTKLSPSAIVKRAVTEAAADLLLVDFSTKEQPRVLRQHTAELCSQLQESGVELVDVLTIEAGEVRSLVWERLRGDWAHISFPWPRAY